MNYYAGIDVSLEYSSVCVVDSAGKIVRESKVASEPEALIGWFRKLGLSLTRIGLEAGPLSQWLYAALRQAGLAVELLETRHVRNALKTMPVKTDRNDARGIAQLSARREGRRKTRVDPDRPVTEGWVSRRAGSSRLDGVTHRYPPALLLRLTVGYAVQSRLLPADFGRLTHPTQRSCSTSSKRALADRTKLFDGRYRQDLTTKGKIFKARSERAD